MTRPKKVLLVGGGTAGWLAVCCLIKAVYAVDPRSVQVHLVESPDIGPQRWRDPHSVDALRQKAICLARTP